MTSRLTESSGSGGCARSETRSVSSQVTEEGCPVIDESGTVCGETRTLGIFQEFRQIYDDCIRKMEGNKDEHLALRKLAPFRKLVEDLWEQNAMLVETVEELEQEATCRVAMLQNKLDQCSEKDFENLIKQKDREICCLKKELSGKDELLSKYYTQMDELRRDMKSRSRRYQSMLNRLKDVATKKLTNMPCEDFNIDEEELNEATVETLFNMIVKEMDMQQSKFSKRMEESCCLLARMSAERDDSVRERAELSQRLTQLEAENADLAEEVKRSRTSAEELGARLEEVKQERDQLLDKVNCLQQNVQELDSSFKETRWALTAEVAEKHDQVQEMRRCMARLEEQVRHADMKTLFKDDVIKEMRKELKNSRSTICATTDNPSRIPVLSGPTPSDPTPFDLPVRETSAEDLKVDICIYPLSEAKPEQALLTTKCRRKTVVEKIGSVEVQSGSRKRHVKTRTVTKTRNVSTQHTTHVEKLPRGSYGTLTVMPWSGAGGDLQSAAEENDKSVYTLPCIGASVWQSWTDRGLVQINAEQDPESENQTSACETRKQLPVRDARSKQFKMISYVTGPVPRLPCSGSDSFEARPSTECMNESDFEELSPQGKLEYLKQVLRLRLEQMQNQDETIRTLEGQLRRAKSYVACLRDKCEGRDDPTRKSELSKHEAKLKKFRDVLLCAASHMQKALRDVSKCQSCKGCTCQQSVADEVDVIECIKKDLEELQVKKCSTESSDKPHDQDTRKIDKRSATLTSGDVDTFRVKAVSGVATLEEMKEEIDTLHDLIRNHYEKLPSDYEKGEIDECESKINKLHAEFDSITLDLCTMLESLEVDPIDGSNGSGEEFPTTSNDLMSERKRLEAEICNQQRQLDELKCSLKEVETELAEKKCLSAEQEKEMKSRDLEITRLRDGVKGFRERLLDMQIDISQNISRGTQLVPTTSCSSLSILSLELQELCEILTSSQMTQPGALEKAREENSQLQEKVNCLEKCLRNKNETLTSIQKTLKLREGQVDDLNGRIECLEAQVSTLRKEVEEKTRRICTLQESMEKAKDFEMKIKDETIGELQFELCGLEQTLRAMRKELEDKEKELESLRDEILYVSSKNFFLNREMDLLEPRLAKMQKHMGVYEDMVCHLQQELRKSECEVESLYEKVKTLEQGLEAEFKKCEQKTLEDSECIKQMSGMIRELQGELQTRKTSEQHEPCKKPNLATTIAQLRSEVQFLRQRLKRAERQDEISTKVANLENIFKQGECRQQAYNDKMNELQKMLKETVMSHETEKKKLAQRLSREENENVKNKVIITKLNETIRKLNCDLDALKARQSQAEERQCRPDPEKLINTLEAQKTDLKARCRTLKSDLEREEKIKRSLENRIKDLNDKLASRTEQFNQLSQNYSCTTAQAEEALTKLRHAEDRLKCMTMEMNRRRLCDDVDDDDGDDLDKGCLQDSLDEKTTECSGLMSEVKCLQAKLKTMHGEYVSMQASKDCELARMNREVKRLECEIDVLEKENCRLKCELTNVQDELKSRSKMDECFKEELERKNKGMCQVMCEKNSLLDSVEELQKRLEELCMDNTAKEKENRNLRDEYVKLKKEVDDLECELCNLRRSYESLQTQYADATEKLKCTEKKMQNFKRLYNRVNQENASLQESKACMEKELCEAQNENYMLHEKISCIKKQKEMEMKKLSSEMANVEQERSKLCSKVKEMNCKMKNLEESVIPQMEDELMRKDRCLENYKMELQEANCSSQRMRDESMRVIQCTKKYLSAQKCANDSARSKSECLSAKETRKKEEPKDLDEQLRSVMRMNDHLYFELQNEKNDSQDTEPRSYSPLPWGHADRDNSSPECYAESGFQSMQPSPTNMNYGECDSKMCSTKQWKNSSGRHTKECSPRRNSSVR